MKRAEALPLTIGLLALALFPAVASAFYLQLVAKIMIMAIFALSLDLLVGFTGLVSFGHAAFYGVGAYALYLLSPEYAASSLYLSLPLAMLAAAVAALMIGLLVVRLSGVYFIMVTLAFAQMLFYYVTGNKALGGSDGAYIYIKPTAGLFGWAVVALDRPVGFYGFVLVALTGTFLLLRALGRSPFGRALIGIKSNERRMRALGFATYRYKLAAFVVAGALAGLAGYLDATQYGFVNPDLFGWRLSGAVLMVVILGGMGTLYGPMLGAFAWVLLQDTLIDTTRHWLLPMGIFIMLAVLLLPQGLGGLIRRGQAAGD
jgi:branched-chain amino acid transport system permease protein